jgi:hypothetical protein
MRKSGHKRFPEFIEEEYISAIETLLSRSKYPRYSIEITRISQDEEKEFGYDGLITSLVPFYVQFKRSIFHTPQFNGKTAKDRTLCGYKNERGFFSFALHKDRNSGRYEQHNALYALSQKAKAAYVAPLFYRRNRLSELKNALVISPWHYRDVVIIDLNFKMKYMPFKRVRILKDSITIPPHREINDRLPSHEYTFTKNGEICFHSEPIPLDIPMKNFIDFIQELLESIIHNPKIDDGRWIFEILPELFRTNWKSRVFKAMIRSYMVKIDLITEGWRGDLQNLILEKMDNISRFLLAESILENEFGIKQYLVKILA